MAWHVVCSSAIIRTLHVGDTATIGRADLPPEYCGHHTCHKPGCSGHHVSQLQCRLRCSMDGIEIASIGANATLVHRTGADVTSLRRGTSCMAARAGCCIVLDSRQRAASTLELRPVEQPRKRKCNEHGSDWEDSDEEDEAPKQSLCIGHNIVPSSLAIGGKLLPPAPQHPKNVWLAEQFEELVRNKKAASGAYRSGDDVDRSVRAYAKQAKQLRMLPVELTDISQLDGMDGFGAGSKGRAKVRELLEIGELRRLSYQRHDSSIQVKAELCKVHGVSGAVADEWYRRGIRSVKQALETAGLLTAQQLVGARHWRDLAERIPREEVGSIVCAVEKAMHTALRRLGLPDDAVHHAAMAVACGSYRRGSADSNDVDVLLTRRDGSSDAHLLSEVVRQLQAAGCSMEHLSHAANGSSQAANGSSQAANGSSQAANGSGDGAGPGWQAYSGVIRLPSYARFRRVDLKLCPPEAFMYAVLHFSSGRDFNIAMRTHAERRGLKLSEKGLFRILSKQQGQPPVCSQQSIPASSEEEIFAALGLRYQPPHERGAQVQLLIL